MNVIHIASETDAVLVNQVAAMLGKGAENLAVPLQDKAGNKYLGCHSSVWTDEDFAAFQARVFSEVCTQEQLAALDRLYESVVLDSAEYMAIDHWNNKLDEWGLIPYLEEEVNV